MKTEKSIKLCGKDVFMRYCAATETGFELLSGKNVSVFIPRFGKNEKGETIVTELPTATSDDFIKLAIAGIVAAYDFRSDENNMVEPPVTTKEIIYEASSEEVTAMVTAIMQLRNEWYHVPATIKKEPGSEVEDKDQKNVSRPARRSKRS